MTPALGKSRGKDPLAGLIHDHLALERVSLFLARVVPFLFF
jgi:hypothetical protein